jgi:hypothetical protein
MAESPAFYPMYGPVLEMLKKMRAADIPFPTAILTPGKGTPSGPIYPQHIAIELRVFVSLLSAHQLF